MDPSTKEQLIQNVIYESEYEVEDIAWWMTGEKQQNHVNIDDEHHYPTPAGYQQINADENENDQFDQNPNHGHFYPPPTQLNQPLVPSSSDNDVLQPGNINNDSIKDKAINNKDPSIAIEPINFELKLIYKKLLLSSIIILIIAILTLLGAIKTSWYNPKGIIFNILIILTAIHGIICGIYTDKYKHLIIWKLKVLLIYFIICCIISTVLFGIEFVDLILLPITNWSIASSHIVLIGHFIFFLGGIIFWIIFTFFYIDLISRACLKRARIGLIISTLNDDHATIWNKILSAIIWFRCKFRKIRRGLTTMTGINFVKLRPILSIKNMVNNGKENNMNNIQSDKEHEEEKIKAILEEGDGQNMISNWNCFACDNDGNEKEQNQRQHYNKCGFTHCCSVIFKTLCILVILYILLPLFLLIIIILLISIIGVILVNIIQTICDCDCVRFKSIYHILAMFVGFICWIYLWFMVICNDANTTSMHDQAAWNWDAQCSMWNESLFVLVDSMIKELLVS